MSGLEMWVEISELEIWEVSVYGWLLSYRTGEIAMTE